MSAYSYENCRMCNVKLTYCLDRIDGICSKYSDNQKTHPCYQKAIEIMKDLRDQEVVWPRNNAIYQALWDKYIEQNFTTENLKYDHTGIKFTGSEVFGVEQKDP